MDSHSDHQELSIVSGNEEVTLTCSVTGDDISGVYWERVNDGLLPNMANMSSFSNDKTILQLLIVRARPMYSGEYRCIVHSEWGVAQSNNITVNIKSKRDSKI